MASSETQLALDPQKEIYALLKFGKRQHLEELRRDGLLFMRPLAEFAQLESDTARGDNFEGTTEILQPHHIRHFAVDGGRAGWHAIDPAHMSGPVRFANGETGRCNVYCMFAATDHADEASVSRQNLQLGDSFVAIAQIDEFLDRVVDAARGACLSRFESGMVEYFDLEAYSGQVGRFRKRSSFAYQSEFRIAVEPGSVAPRKLFVGSIIDIASDVLPISDVNEYLDLRIRGVEGVLLK
ncbi:MAG: hypothetical protein ACLQHF_06240 [Terracidiphilus sp.]